MKLTLMILDYWRIWMKVPVATNLWSLAGDIEGLGWYDGHHANFWYMLNVEWYRMNDKLYAFTGCDEPFDQFMMPQV